ncbi:50S ribosomal protein L21e [Candidatus Tiddalikarchaeum anstoanum]|nr:50S ribosomal protein L21e [Candidatus Tiddalikarchaeum anstoanum]
MVVKSHGGQVKSRNSLRKTPRNKGKFSVSRCVQPFKDGDRVIIKVEPTVKDNQVHHRFMNRLGTIMGRRGKAYVVKVNDFGKDKTIYVIPIHLRKLVVTP